MKENFKEGASKNYAVVNYLGEVYTAILVNFEININKTEGSYPNEKYVIILTVGSWAYYHNSINLIPFEPFINITEEDI